MEEQSQEFRETGRTNRHVVRAVGLLLSPNTDKKNTTYVTYTSNNWGEPARLVIRILNVLGVTYVYNPHLRSIYFAESGNILFFAGKEETHKISPKFQNIILDI